MVVEISYHEVGWEGGKKLRSIWIDIGKLNMFNVFIPIFFKSSFLIKLESLRLKL